jgi:large subunit ribosomal protein L3
MKDAVKRSLPKEAPKPGAFRMPEGTQAKAPAAEMPAASE